MCLNINIHACCSDPCVHAVETHAPQMLSYNLNFPGNLARDVVYGLCPYYRYHPGTSCTSPPARLPSDRSSPFDTSCSTRITSTCVYATLYCASLCYTKIRRPLCEKLVLHVPSTEYSPLSPSTHRDQPTRGAILRLLALAIAGGLAGLMPEP